MACSNNELDVSRGTSRTEVRAEFCILLACSIAKLEEKPSTRKKRTRLRNMNETYWNICTWLSLGISNTIYDHALDLPYAQEEVKPAPELAEKKRAVIES